MAQGGRTDNPARLIVLGLVAVIVVAGLILLVVAVSRALAPASARDGVVDALAQSNDECVVCHRRATPGIVQQFGHSTMAAAEVLCADCHEVAADYPGGVEHEGTWVLSQPTPAMCRPCHTAEVVEFSQSRHALPAYVAYAGVDALTPDLAAIYQAIPEAELGPLQARQALYDIEGPEVTQFACEACHNVGLPAADGSVGQCEKCHLRHEFSLAQVRKPETCNYCHIGPDHPQWEIYHESPHGVAYTTEGETWAWDAEAGTLTVEDMSAATCAICHMSGFGATGTSHDVGERLSWYLFAPVSEQRPNWQENRVRMQNVCRQCHNEDFIFAFYDAADGLTEEVNRRVQQGQAIVAPLSDAGLLTADPFDQPIDFVSFELWHHWGRTAKFGAWMQGPDYTQWHGVYEMLSDLAELEEMARTIGGAGR